ncbi:uncharacterized protein LOC127792011 [Diospyros lotus]|uniref:uncharacterized protein LOC127792011 n=1 Tax=Diospyros lotus TaxID=55363 RepID=UPI002253D3A9|nr:uncharacterized protein LOC127792011 [Diospyros lotus]
MASVLSSTATKSASLIRGRRRSEDEVYVAAVPLRATKGPAKLAMAAAYSLNLWELQHFIVILKPPSSHEPLVFDFQPQDPEDIFVALAALSGRQIPGVVLVRRMKKLPTRRCWFIGHSRGDDAVDVAHKFNQNWQTGLRIGSHDCRNYTNGLVEHLTGEKCVLEQLRRKQVHLEK